MAVIARQPATRRAGRFPYGATGEGESPFLTVDTLSNYVEVNVDGLSPTSADNINTILAAGRTAKLIADVTITKPIVFSEPNTGIDLNGYTLTLSMASGAFDNDVFSDRYSITTEGGKKYAVGIDGEDLEGLFVVNGYITTSAWTDNRYVKAISFLECDKFAVNDVEFYGFSRARGIIAVNDCDDFTIKNCIFRDSYSNSTSGDANSAQITGIEVDGDCLVGSKRIRITGNTFKNLTMGSAARAALGYQTDGINIQGTYPKATIGGIISGNKFYNVADAVDCFGSNIEITANYMERCYAHGVKLIHGASHCNVHGNTLVDVGRYAITVNVADENVPDGNQVYGNIIKGVMPDIDWMNADGSYSYRRSENSGNRAWNTDSTCGIDVNPGSSGNVPINTVIKNNHIDLLSDAGGAGLYGFYMHGDAGRGMVVYEYNNTVLNPATSRVLDPRGYLLSDTFTLTQTISGSLTSFGFIINQTGNGGGLRVTNSGTGDTLLIEDAANPDSTPVRVDASGNFGMGVASGSTVQAYMHLRKDNSGALGPEIFLHNRTGSAGSASRISSSNGAVDLADTRFASINFELNGTSGNDVVIYPNANGASQVEVARAIGQNQRFVLSGSLSLPAPVTKTADFTIAATENYLINNKSGSACSVTMPAAANFAGRAITIKTIQAQAVNSVASNIVPLAGGAASTAILTGTAGKWAILVSNGTNWEIMAAN